jgi:hypothetical protein
MRFSKHISTVISGARSFRFVLTAGFFAGLLALNFLTRRGWAVEEAARLMPLRCPLFFLTGIQCPTCGLGRSVVAALTGEIGLSLHYHPFGVPLVVSTFLALFGWWFFPQRLSLFLSRSVSFLRTKRSYLLFLVLFYGLWGFLRNLPAEEPKGDVGFRTDDAAYIKPLLPQVEVVPLLTVGESVPLTGDPSRSYRLVGIPDGMGAYKTPDGKIRLFVNHELKKDAVSQPIAGAPLQTGAFISEFVLTADLKIVSGKPAFTTIFRGTDPQPAGGSLGRLCSGFLAGPETGFDRAIYLTGEESMGAETLDGKGGQAIAVANGVAYLLPEMGRFSKENIVAVRGTGIKTVVFGLEDGPSGLKSQLYLYIGEKKFSSTHPLERNGLAGGRLYVFKATTTGKTDESNFRKSDGVIVGRWMPLADAGRMNDVELDERSRAAGSFNFDRLEDGTYDRNKTGIFYFVSTGGSSSANRRGRLYKLTFDVNDPVNRPSTLEILLEGDAGDPLLNPDNLDANEEGQLLIEEDTASLKSFLTGRANFLWLYDLKSGKLERVAEALNRWEPSGAIDASAFFGPGWLVNVQAGSISSREASRLQGYDQDAYLAEGGQILLLRTGVKK